MNSYKCFTKRNSNFKPGCILIDNAGTRARGHCSKHGDITDRLCDWDSDKGVMRTKNVINLPDVIYGRSLRLRYVG